MLIDLLKMPPVAITVILSLIYILAAWLPFDPIRDDMLYIVYVSTSLLMTFFCCSTYPTFQMRDRSANGYQCVKRLLWVHVLWWSDVCFCGFPMLDDSLRSYMTDTLPSVWLCIFVFYMQGTNLFESATLYIVDSLISDAIDADDREQ
eukprot:TRINITY_DN52990_c0_g1_i1.p1 TRINITY_DN52990_c0_g1~~TRINITY_DN52990_c0_g1_i1.p1  ORF type:complete len:148 (-),score=5.36 TRINITY_DN52990_c0_g1_i1:88-531(-)